MKHVSRIAKVVGLIVLLLVVCVASYGTYRLYPIYGSIKTMQEVGDSHWERFRGDASVFDQYSNVFSENHVGKDASMYLNPIIPWDWAEEESDAANLSKEWNLRHASPPKLKFSKEQVQSLQTCFSSHAKDTICANLPKEWNINLGWMEGLNEFDFWSIEKNSPNQSLSPSDIKMLTHSSLPEYQQLIAATRLRLLVGLNEPSVDQAVEEVLHLSRLIMSNNNIVSKMVGISILKSLRVYVEREAASGKISSSVIAKTPTQESLEKAKRVMWAMPHYMQPIVGKAHTRISQLVAIPGYCSALREAILSASLTKPLLSEYYPDEFQAVGHALKTQVCGMDVESKLFHEHATLDWYIKTQTGSEDYATNIKSLKDDHPYINMFVGRPVMALVGFILIGVSQPDRFKLFNTADTSNSFQRRITSE